MGSRGNGGRSADTSSLLLTLDQYSRDMTISWVSLDVMGPAPQPVEMEETKFAGICKKTPKFAVTDNELLLD